ncbi:hypothetical protein PRIPAC_76828 [Pristionchus pacificus]|nr:hypothetical protein PRIPAC_76828 [Pristionchus pacificus]
MAPGNTRSYQNLSEESVEEGRRFPPLGGDLKWKPNQITIIFGSLPKDFVQIIKALKCNNVNCDNRFSSKLESLHPHFAPCSHLVCTDCVDKCMNKEIQFACKQCPVTKRENMQFIPYSVLIDLYKAIDNDGYRCSKCNELHPLWNTVICMICSKSNTSPSDNEEKGVDKENEYLCVWCACKEHKQHNRACLDTKKNMTSMRSEDALSILLVSKDCLCCIVPDAGPSSKLANPLVLSVVAL